MADITRIEYIEEVERIARELEKQYIEGDIDQLDDALHEYIDEHQWVIYTHSHFDVLKHSDHWQAATEEGVMNPTDDVAKMLQTCAFWAMLRDVETEFNPREYLDEKRAEREASIITIET